MVNKVPPTPTLPISADPYLRELVRAVLRMGIDLAARVNAALPEDGSERMRAPLLLAEYTTLTLPAAADWTGGIVYDTTTGTVKRSNGSVWTSL